MNNGVFLPIEITQREDPDLRKGLGSIYKPI